MAAHLRIRVLPIVIAIAVVAIAGAWVTWRAVTDPYAHEHTLALVTAPLPALMATLAVSAAALPPAELTGAAARSPRQLAAANLGCVLTVAVLGLLPLAPLRGVLPPEPLATSYSLVTALRNLVGLTGLGLVLARAVGTSIAGVAVLAFSLFAQLYGRPPGSLSISWWAAVLQPTGHLGALVTALAAAVGGALALRGRPLRP